MKRNKILTIVSLILGAILGVRFSSHRRVAKRELTLEERVRLAQGYEDYPS